MHLENAQGEFAFAVTVRVRRKTTPLQPSPLPPEGGLPSAAGTPALAGSAPLVQPPEQLPLERSGSEQGYVRWLGVRKTTAAELARRMGLPLGHKVEVWLCGGVRLRGTLRLQEELLLVEEERVRHLELVVDHVPFAYREIESCVRMD